MSLPKPRHIFSDKDDEELYTKEDLSGWVEDGMYRGCIKTQSFINWEGEQIIPFLFEYPQLFQDIQNFQDIQLCDIGRCPRTLEYP